MVSNRRTNIRRIAAAVGTAALLSAGMTPAANAQSLPAPLQPTADQIAAQVEQIINQPGVPEEVKSALGKAIGFITGKSDGEPGWEQPENAPATTDFFIPSAAEKCINGEGRSFGLATSVPGPAPLPLPGVPAHQLGYIFTGLGTSGVYENQSNMKVHWVNIANGQYGTTPLTYNGINADSHGTVNGVANTGSGIVVSLLEGGFTANEETGPSQCNYTPTAGIMQVR